MKRKGLFCDSWNFIFDQKWHNLSLSDLVLADSILISHIFIYYNGLCANWNSTLRPRAPTGLKSTVLLRSPWKSNLILPWKVLVNHSKSLKLKSLLILLFNVWLIAVHRQIDWQNTVLIWVKLFDTLMIILKEFFENVDFEKKISRRQINQEKLSNMQC